LFCEGNVKKVCIDAHREALKGSPVQQIIKNNDRVYYVSIIPRRNDAEEISGVLGLSWDITSNHVILENLNDILNISSSKKDDDYQLIKDLAESSIKTSRLNSLALLDKSKK